MTDKMTGAQLDASELGRRSAYETQYNPELLFPIPREGKRREIGVDPEHLPFYGVDIWNHYEVSWLNAKGKPVVAVAEIIYDSHSTHIIESKSLKLYFNSFNGTTFDSWQMVEQTITRDLSERLHVAVQVKLFPLCDQYLLTTLKNFEGESIDGLDVVCDTYVVKPDFLTTENEIVEEVLCSDLLKSNCLVTHQPDWGSVQIAYLGARINREGLLKYIVSFRDHNEFHEQCIERIFVDIQKYCQPEKLTVYGRYTRRGGIDINPYRSSEPVERETLVNGRMVRQ